MDKQKRCFVISPIGADDSDIRKHADDVLEFIIKEACKRAGYIAYRADKDTKSGIITEHMIDSILTDDLLIGVLTFHNPNVFYEVAIAEAAARPLILLIQKGSSIPFDIKDRRVLTYDFDPRNIKSDTHVENLYRMIQSCERETHPRTVPFRPNLPPLGSRDAALRLDNRVADIAASDRIKLLDDANSFVHLQGLALTYYRRNNDLLAAVDRVLERKIEFRVVLMDLESKALPFQLAGLNSDYYRKVQEDIRHSIEFWREKARTYPTLQLRIQRESTMFFSLQQNEHGLIMFNYARSDQTHVLPAARATAKSALYQFADREFRMAFDTAKEVSTNHRQKRAVRGE